MEKFTVLNGLVAPLDRANVDTDQIIPKQYLSSIKRTGFGQGLFAEWRKDPQFVLNQPRFKGASILLARKNFGCGSSREHAPWALADYGFRCVIAPSFADIFYANCCQNGLLPVALADDEVNELFRRRATSSGYELTIDLEKQSVRDELGFRAGFHIDDYRRQMLLQGLDEIGRTLLQEPLIAAFERRQAAQG